MKNVSTQKKIKHLFRVFETFNPNLNKFSSTDHIHSSKILNLIRH